MACYARHSFLALLSVLFAVKFSQADIGAVQEEPLPAEVAGFSSQLRGSMEEEDLVGMVEGEEVRDEQGELIGNFVEVRRLFEAVSCSGHQPDHWFCQNGMQHKCCYSQ